MRARRSELTEVESSSSYASPDAGSFLPAGQTQAVQQEPMSRYQQAKRQRQDLKTKANQLRQAGRTIGTFVQGELQR